MFVCEMSDITGEVRRGAAGGGECGCYPELLRALSSGRKYLSVVPVPVPLNGHCINPADVTSRPSDFHPTLSYR